MAKPLPPDYREFLRLLNERQVKYLMVGAHALGLHGYPRNTEDLDIWLAIGEENASRVVQMPTAWTTAS